MPQHFEFSPAFLGMKTESRRSSDASTMCATLRQRGADLSGVAAVFDKSARARRDAYRVGFMRENRQLRRVDDIRSRECRIFPFSPGPRTVGLRSVEVGAGLTTDFVEQILETDIFVCLNCLSIRPKTGVVSKLRLRSGVHWFRGPRKPADSATCRLDRPSRRSALSKAEFVANAAALERVLYRGFDEKRSRSVFWRCFSC